MLSSAIEFVLDTLPSSAYQRWPPAAVTSEVNQPANRKPWPLPPRFGNSSISRPCPLVAGLYQEPVMPCWFGLIALKLEELSSTDTVLSVLFATITSGRPSPLMSATAASTGSLPAVNVCTVANVGTSVPTAIVL